jgi:alcohol dehydrogenase
MKAAILKAFGSPLAIETLPDPVLGTGEVVVDVVAAGVVPYAAEVISNERPYLMELPMVLGPGAIGRVRAAGPDATRLKPGDWVSCDATVRARDDALTPDITLQGWTSRGEGGLKLARHFHHGAWAEQMMVPTENAIPIGAIEAVDVAKWCAIGLLLVPYGGLLAVNLQAGETVVVSGATGNFGSAAVAVALAMGAARVVAPGRNEAMLKELSRRFGPRVATAKLSGNEAEDCSRIKAAAAGPVDVVLDLLPPSVDARVVRTAAMTVREFGRIVLMGGVGMAGGDDLALPYPWIMRDGITIRGQWMYPRTANRNMVNLIRSGLIDLDNWEVARFSLDRANEAVAHAAKSGGPFRMTVIAP